MMLARPPYRHILPALLPLTAAALLLTACMDESVVEAPDKGAADSRQAISFGLRSRSYSWGDETRAAAQSGGNASTAIKAMTFDVPERRLLHDDVTGDSLWLSICSEPLDDPNDALASGNAPTRASIVTTATIHDNFGVYASLYDADATSAKLLYIDNARVSRTTDASTGATSWSFDGDHQYYWLGANYALSFFTFAPHEIDGLTASEGSGSDKAPVLHYACPATAKQADLLVASATRVSGNYGQALPLSFRHALAVVQIVEGSSMQPGSIKSISLRNVYSEGDYDYTTDEWTLDTSKKQTYSLAWSSGLAVKQNPGEVITTDDNCFIILPQKVPDTAVLRIVFNDSQTGLERTIDGKLSGVSFKKGSRTRLIINIDANYSLGFDDDSTPLDCHYIIAKLPFTVSGIDSSVGWTMTASASDGANVTLQKTADLNEYAAQGYWTDVMYTGSTSGTSTSARGTATVSGTGPGNYDFSIFIPENVSDNNRTVTLTLKVSGASNADAVTKSIIQYHPAWTADGLGWEQLQDTRTTSYGFAWNRKVSYVYSYSGTTTSQRSTYNTYVTSLVTNNNASGFASVGNFTYKSGLIITYTRYYIQIDYSKMNNLNSYNLSTSDGLGNTRTLYSKGGEILTNNFEDLIMSTLKTESGKEDEKAFRMADATNDYKSWSNLHPSGSIPKGPMSADDVNNGIKLSDNTEGSAAVGEVLKRNRYYIVKLTSTVDGVTSTSYALRIKDDDIVWFLPARDQFANAPTNVQEAIDPSDLWSSSPLSNGSQSYLGDGSAADRNDYHYVRAVRIKQ